MLLAVNHLVKTYERGGVPFRAVDDVSFSLEEKEMMAIVGESGSGKSTLGRLLCQFAKPDSGQILFEGCDITHLPSRHQKELYRKLQMVFQNPIRSFHPRFTLGKSIQAGLRNYHIQLGREEKEQLLREVHLSPDHLDRYPHQVSGGECQRAAVLRALCLRPKLLICDEATSALDVSIREEIASLIKASCQRHQIACLFITHDLRLARQLCDTMLVMNRGRVVERGETETVFSHPRADATKALLDSLL